AQLASKAGEKTKLSAGELFGGFFTVQNRDGTTNRNNINLYQRLPPSFDSTQSCAPGSAADPCINEAYDTRVVYDPYAGRFVVLSAIRGVQLDDTTSNVIRRFVAIAISRSEDPRDGFDQVMTTESNYSDWPRIATGDGVIVVAHSACKAS